MPQDTLILIGEQDAIIPAANAERLAERIPNSKVVRMPEGGHGFFFQFPDVTTQIVNGFLQSQ